MGAVVQAIQFVLGKIVAFAKWIGDLFKEVFVSLWELVTDAFIWCFDGLLGVTVSVLNTVDVSPLQATQGAWRQLPGMLLEALAAIGLVPALGVIVSAIGIRLVLQLIPFTRLGS